MDPHTRPIGSSTSLTNALLERIASSIIIRVGCRQAASSHATRMRASASQLDPLRSAAVRGRQHWSAPAPCGAAWLGGDRGRVSHSGGFGLSGSIEAFCRDGLRITSPSLDDSSRMSSRLSFRLRRSHGAKPPDGSGSTATGAAAAGAWSGGAAERHMRSCRAGTGQPKLERTKVTAELHVLHYNQRELSYLSCS